MNRTSQKMNPDIVIDLTEIADGTKKNLGLDDYFYLKDYQERRHFITDVIDAMTVEDVCKAIMQCNREDYGSEPDQRRPITIYLDTPGGDISAGLKLIDVIQCSKTPVHIVNIGTCYSMGFIIYIVGHKRIASRNATFLMHDGSIDASGTTSKTRDMIEFNDRVEARLKSLVLETTHISSEMYHAKSRQEWYMFADEAKTLGVVDEIIGVDCDIDDALV